MTQYGFKLFTDLDPSLPSGKKSLGPIFAHNKPNNINNITDEDKWFEYKQEPNTPNRGFSFTGIPYRVDPNHVTERNFWVKSEPYDIEDIRSLYLKDKKAAIKALSEYIAAHNEESPLSLLNYIKSYDQHFGNYYNPLYAIEADGIMDDEIDDSIINGYSEEVDLGRDSLAEYQAARIRPVKLLSLDFYGKQSLDNNKLNNNVLDRLLGQLKLYKDKKISFNDFNRLYTMEQLKDFVKEHRGQIGSDHLVKAIKRRFQ